MRTSTGNKPGRCLFCSVHGAVDCSSIQRILHQYLNWDLDMIGSGQTVGVGRKGWILAQTMGDNNTGPNPAITMHPPPPPPPASWMSHFKQTLYECAVAHCWFPWKSLFINWKIVNTFRFTFSANMCAVKKSMKQLNVSPAQWTPLQNDDRLQLRNV